MAIIVSGILCHSVQRGARICAVVSGILCVIVHKRARICAIVSGSLRGNVHRRARRWADGKRDVHAMYVNDMELLAEGKIPCGSVTGRLRYAL